MVKGLTYMLTFTMSWVQALVLPGKKKYSDKAGLPESGHEILKDTTAESPGHEGGKRK